MHVNDVNIFSKGISGKRGIFHNRKSVIVRSAIDFDQSPNFKGSFFYLGNVFQNQSAWPMVKQLFNYSNKNPYRDTDHSYNFIFYNSINTLLWFSN